MKFVFRHISFFSRPSSIDGHEWEDKHDPEIMLDLKVGVSCLLFLLVAATMYWIGDVVGGFVYTVVTLFSTLSDAVFYNHYWLDTIDRFVAAIGALYMAMFSLRWLFLVDDLTHVLVWVKLCTQCLSGMTPFKFLDQCRQYPVRSENWRQYHVMWHVTGTLAMIVSLMIGEGYFDEHLTNLLDLEQLSKQFSSLLVDFDLMKNNLLSDFEPISTLIVDN